MAPEAPLTRGLILASASPRRRELLAQVGVAFDVEAAAIDETPRSGEAAVDYVVRMAEEKARAVARGHPEAAVIGADTSVVLDGRILGKPENDSAARDMLSALSGSQHQVMTAVALLKAGRLAHRLSRTEVDFAELTAGWIDGYIASGDPMDKAGAYGIQAGRDLIIESVEGSIENVMGLPIQALAACFKELGFDFRN